MTFARKTIVGLVLAGLAGAAMAQSTTEKTDIFGRPYVNQTALGVYEQADPLGLLPQLEQRRQEQLAAQPKTVNTASNQFDIFGRPYTNLFGVDVYYESAPYDPLPQIVILRNKQLAEDAVAPVVASGKTDIFGRPYTGFDGLQALHASDPFSPIPQFWGHENVGVGAVAATPATEKVSQRDAGGNS
jgi:hypothetical protein